MRLDETNQPGVENLPEGTRLLGSARCISCQDVDGRCVIIPNEDCCALCAGTSKDCHFRRAVTKTLPMRYFSQQELTDPRLCVPLDHDPPTLSNSPGFAAGNPSQLPPPAHFHPPPPIPAGVLWGPIPVRRPNDGFNHRTPLLPSPNQFTCMCKPQHVG